MESAPAVAGSSIPQLKSSFQDLARLFLSLSGSHEQLDVFSAATISGAGSLPGLAAPVPVAAPSACLSARVSAPGEGSPAGGASTTGSPGRRERSRKSTPLSCHGGRSPSPVRSSRLAHSSASSSSAGAPEGVMPPSSAGCPGAGGGRSERDRSAAGRYRSPRPGPSGLDLGSRSSPMTGLSYLGDGGRSSPSPSGAGDDDLSNTVYSLDLDRDDSFRAVLRLIREFHSLEEPASVALNQLSGYNQSLPRHFTCLLPLYCGLSLRTQTRHCPSL